jgi:alcohol dehydrogenase (cytochrome c)
MSRTGISAVGFALAILSLDSRTAQAQERALSFTTEQAAAGQAAYNANCVTCHGLQLNGPSGKPLKGPEFMQKYGGKSPAVLFEVLRTTMPTGRPNSLDLPTYAALTAFLLRENAIVAGENPLPSDTRELAKMQVPASGFSLIGYSPYAPLKAATLPNPLTGFTPVTNADLASPPAKDWLTWRRSWDAHGSSPLTQITGANVGGLRLAWSWTLPPGSAQAVPLVRDSTLFVEGFGDIVQAIDARTGDLLWQYAHPLEQGAAPNQKRGIALWGERLYIGTSDVHIVALDVRTGKVAWDTRVGDFKAREGLTGGPLVADGRLLVGTTGTGVGAKPGGPQLIALDASSGKELWRIGTIAKPGEHGGESWNGVPFLDRSGASVWTPPSYDPGTGLAYFGTGNTYDTAPLLRPQQPGMTRDALYTNATIAVNPATGKIAWYRQHFPNDQWDLDWAFERQLVDLEVRDVKRRVVITAGKIGIYDALDARTGEFLFSIDLGLQNIVRAIDPVTGEKQVDTSLYPGDGRVKMTCPHAVGARSYLPAAWSAQQRVLFMPLNETCMDVFPVPGGGKGTMNTGVNVGIRPRPDGDGNYGRLQALDLATRKPLWTVRMHAPVTSGVLATSGGVVFAATYDRVFHAYDAASGKQLWQARLNDASSSSPISYAVDGKQYIAITVGAGVHASSFDALLPELKSPPNRGAALWVFSLP